MTKSSRISAESGKERIEIITFFKPNRFFKTFDVACLALNLSLYRIFTKSTLSVTQSPGGSGVISALGAGAFAIFILGLLVLFFSKYSSRFESLHFTFAGGFFRHILSLAVLLYLGLSFATTTGEFSFLAQKIAFPKSPLWFVAGFFIIAAFIGAFCGFSAILRLSGILVPVCGVGIAFLCLLTAPSGSIFNLFPILGNGIPQTIRSGTQGLLLYADILLLFLIIPEAENRKSYYKAIFCGAVTAFLLNILFVFSYTLAVSAPEAVGEHIPVYLLLKEVRLGRFIQRIDAVIQLLSAFSGFLQLAFILRLAAAVLKKLLNIPQKSGGEILEEI